MGALSYNESFGMLARGQSHRYLDMLRETLLTLNLFSHLGWLVPILKREGYIYYYNDHRHFLSP